MLKSAKLCPGDKNIKLLIRHSIRQEIKPDASIEEIEKAQLTKEGRKMAECFGESLEIEIGTVSSSQSQRCIDTAQEIINGYNLNHAEYKQPILKTDMLQTSQCKNVPEERDSWERLKLPGIFDCFAKNIDIPGFYSLEEAVKRMLDYIFNTGNKKHTLDIYCTHDFQIAMLMLYLNESREKYKEVMFNRDWPFMLEGMFLWEDKNKINITWRGDIKIIQL
jgi:broad specificity phosphatase PhoE